jgi:hypothetical protein
MRVMRSFVLRKRVLIPAGIVSLLILAAGAIAYFTSSGSGTATATVGSSSAVTLHGSAASTLYPGTSSTVSFTVDNPSPGTQRVGTIHLASVSTDAAHSACVVADFTMPDVVSNQSFPNGNTQAVTATGTLSMANTGISQDACQGAPLTLNLTSN